MSATVILKDDPFTDWKRDTVQFRLTYEGPLVAETSKGRKVPGRADDKQFIRKKIHPQLRRLWREHPFLAKADSPMPAARPGFKAVEFGRPKMSTAEIAKNNAMFGYEFVPLVRSDQEILCSIDILVLRPHPAGSPLHDGDLDNRLKTLIDGLQRPRTADQLGPSYQAPDADERPFFVLLENDSLVSKISVEADTLLEALPNSYGVNDARVVITVRLQPFVLRPDNIGFG
jgi:hypothetical protein